MKNKRYFQCLLMSFDLYRAGVAEFKSGKPSTYYEFLLRKRKLPDPDQKMADLRKELNAEADLDKQFPVPVLPVPTPAALDDDCEIAWDLGDIIPPAAGPELEQPLADDYVAPPPGPPAGEPELNSEEVVAGDPADDGPGHSILRHARDWPSHLDGYELKKIAGRQGSVRFSTRLGIQCPCCMLKTRSTTLHRAELGDDAALYFLGSWIEKFGELDPAAHRVWTPTLEQMRSYKACKFPD